MRAYAFAMALLVATLVHSADDWTSQDINTAISGVTSSVGSDGFDIRASGADIWGTADGFRYVYQQLNGDFDFRARMASVGPTDPWSKAGLMVRQSLAPNSQHAMVIASGTNGFAFQSRSIAGGSSVHSYGGATSYPFSWVRLVKVGALVTAYKAIDLNGVEWVQIGTPLSLELTEPFYLGLCVTAHNNTLLCKAEFRNIQLATFTTPVVANGDGLLGKYFNAIGYTAAPVLTRIDPTIAFEWGTTAPDATVNADNFSVQWSGTIQPQYNEAYTFYTVSDDGVRLWIDNKLVIDNWTDHSPTENRSLPIQLQVGQAYSIILETYERTGGATAKLLWSSRSTTKQLVPQTQLFSTAVEPVPSNGVGLKGNYFANRDLSNAPVVRIDSTVDFNWASGSPMAGIPSDNFSVRWTGVLQPQYSGQYTFYTSSDDGVRLWVDNQLVVNNWTDHSAVENSGSVPLSAGKKYHVVMEYYERTGQSIAKMLWSSALQEKQVIPAENLYPSSGVGFFAEYFSDSELTTKKLVRIDPQIDFDWSLNPPDAQLQPENYSVRWSGVIEPTVSTDYTFNTETDGGVRLWVGDTLIIDQWQLEGESVQTSPTVHLNVGQQYAVKMEYANRIGAGKAKLEWAAQSQLPQALDTWQVYPGGTMFVSMPTQSSISPVFVEGTVWSPASGTNTVTAYGATTPTVTKLGNSSFYVSMPLSAGANALTVTHTGAGVSESGVIEWSATDLFGKTNDSDQLLLRKGDALLLTANGPGNALTIDTNTDGTIELSGSPGQKFPTTFDQAGTFLVTAYIDGKKVGAILVGVVEVDLIKPIACQVNYTREKNVVINPPAFANRVTFTSADDSMLSVSTKGYFDNSDGKGMTIRLATRQRGTPILCARLGHANGPIIAYKEIDEFTIEVINRADILENDETDIGTVTMKMHPYVPDIKFNFNMFASLSTFQGGIRSFTANSMSFVQSFDAGRNETEGILKYDVETPDGENKACYTISMKQSSSAEQEVGKDSSNNPKICKAICEKVQVCLFEETEIKLRITQTADAGTYEPVINPTLGVIWTQGQPTYDCKTGGIVHGGPGIRVESPGSYDIAFGGAFFEDCICGVGLTIDPGDEVKGCVNQDITFTATGQEEGGTYSWTAPGGTPETGSGPTFTTKYSSSMQYYYVTCTYTKDYCSCSKTVEVEINDVRVDPCPVELCIGEEKGVYVESGAGNLIIEYAADAPFELAGASSGNQVPSGTIITLRGIKCGEGELIVRSKDVPTCRQVCKVTVKSFKATPLNGFPELCVAPEEWVEIIKVEKCPDASAESTIRVSWTPDDPEIFEVRINGAEAMNGGDYETEFTISIKAKKCKDGQFTLIPIVDGEPEESCKQELPFSMKNFHVTGPQEKRICEGEETSITVSKCKPGAPNINISVEYDVEIIQVIRNGVGITEFTLDADSVELTVKGIKSGFTEIKFSPLPMDPNEPDCVITKSIDVTKVNQLTAVAENGRSKTVTQSEDNGENPDPQEPDEPLFVCANSEVLLFADWANGSRGDEYASFIVEPAIGVSQSAGTFASQPVILKFSRCETYTVYAWCDHNQNLVVDDGEQEPVALTIEVGKLDALIVSSKVGDVASDPGSDKVIWACAGKSNSVDVYLRMEICPETGHEQEFLWEVVQSGGGLVASGAADAAYSQPTDTDEDYGVFGIRVDLPVNSFGHQFIISAGCDKNGDGTLQSEERDSSVQVNVFTIKKITVTELRNPDNKVIAIGEGEEAPGIYRTKYCPGEPFAIFSVLLETQPNDPDAHKLVRLKDEVIGTGYQLFESNPVFWGGPETREFANRGGQLVVYCRGENASNADNIRVSIASHVPIYAVDANHDGSVDEQDAWQPGIFTSGFGLTNHLALGDRIRVVLYPYHYNFPFPEDAPIDELLVRCQSQLDNSHTLKIFDSQVGGQELLPEQAVPNSTFKVYKNVPRTIFVECRTDEVFGFIVGDDINAYTHGQRKDQEFGHAWGYAYPTVHLSNGFGAPDGSSASSELIPGHAYINAATGNLYFGDTVKSYITPALAPSVTLSYNHLDGIGSGKYSFYAGAPDTFLQRGWRTNYGMRIFDGSPFRQTCDDPETFVPTPEDRANGDLLVLIDDTGKRRLFKYEGNVFKSEKSGWPGATVDANRENFPEVADAEYKLNRNDNLFYFFDADGDLIQIVDLRDNKLTIEPGVEVVDDFGRTESLERSSFETNGTTPLYLDTAGGRQLGAWQFQYESGDPNVPVEDPYNWHRRLKTIRLNGSFSHGSSVEYKIEYESTSGKVTKITMPPAGGDTFVKELTYTPANQFKASTQTTVKEPFGGQTVFKIKPDLDAAEQIKNAVGQTLVLEIDDKTRRVRNTSMGGYSVSMSYDTKGNMVTWAENGGVTKSYTYGEQGIEGANLMLTSSISGVSGSTRFTYGGGGNSKGLVEEIRDPLSNRTQFNYVAKGFLGSTIDARNNTWNVTGRNSFGQPTNISTPEGRTITYTYNASGRTTSYKEPLMSYTTAYEYDSRERLTKTTQPGGAYSEVTYDPLSRTLSSRDLNERLSSFTLDAIGRVTAVSQPGIAAVNVTYTRTGTGFNVEKKRGSRILSKEKIDFIGRTTETTVLRSLNGTDATECTTKYQYLPQGWIDFIQDPLNGKMTYVYAQDGKVSSILSPAGTSTRFEYDGARRLSKQTLPDGQVTQTVYDSLNRVQTTTNPEGGTTTYVYDPLGNVESVSRNDGSTPIASTYDNDGVQLTRTDVLGRVHKLTVEEATKTYRVQIDNNPDRTIAQTLDGRGNIQSMTQSGYGTTSISTRPDGVVTSAQPAGRGAFERTLDDQDRTRSITTPSATATFEFDAQQGDPTTQKTALELNVSTNVNTATGDVLSANDDESTGGHVSKVVRRDKNGNVLEYLDGENLTWKQEFDADNRRIKLTSPDNVETQWVFGSGNRVQSMISGGETTSYEYNGLDQVTKVTDNSGKFVSSTYDKFGRLETTTSGGYTTVRAYKPGSKLLETVTAPGGRVTRYIYDNNGRMTDLIDPNQGTTHYDYNDFDQVTNITHPDMSTESFDYYANGDLQTHVDRGNRITKFFYDGAGRLSQKQFMGTGETVSYGYNGADQVTSETYSSGTSVSREYDKRGRLRRVDHGNGSVTVYTYRNDDMLATKTYAGKSITYQYAANGRLAGITGDLGNASFGYYANGRVQSMSLPNNVTRQFGYDGAGRIETLTQNLGATNPIIENYNYSYDGAGKLQSLACNRNVGENWTLGLQYDAAGRLEVETRTGEGTYQQVYEYDNNDNRTKVTRNPGTQEVRVLTFNGSTIPGELAPATGTWNVINGKLLGSGSPAARAAINTGAATGKYSVSVRIDPDSVLPGMAILAGVEFGVQITGRYVVGMTVTKLGAQAQRRLQLYWVPADTGIPEFVAEAPAIDYFGDEVSLSFALVNDAITARIVQDGDAGELSANLAQGAGGAVGLSMLSLAGSAATAQFDDFTWTRVLAAAEVRDFQYNAFNQLLSVRGAEWTDFTYDAAGRLSTRTRDGVLTTFDHDRLDRLVGMNVGGSVNTFGYAGPSWIRTSSTVEGNTTNFIYDGHACVAQTSGSKTTHYAVFGSSPLWEQTNNVNTVYAQDGRGSVTGLWNGTDFTAKFVYDGFGRMFATDKAGNPLANTSGPRFQSEFFDASTDLVYLRNRFYDPVIGRFMSLDPKGMVDGPNMYNYCAGDPVNRVDPMGTDYVWASGSWIRVPPYLDEDSTPPTRQGYAEGEVVLEQYRGVSELESILLKQVGADGGKVDFVRNARGYAVSMSYEPPPVPRTYSRKLSDVNQANTGIDVIDTFGDFGTAVEEVIADLPQTAPVAIKQAASDFVNVDKRIAHIEEQISRVSNVRTDSRSASIGVINLAMELQQARALKDGALSILRGMNFTRLVPKKLSNETTIGGNGGNNLLLPRPTHPHAHGFTIRDINPKGGDLNCAECAIYVDDLLATGAKNTARITGVTDIDQVERALGKTFSGVLKPNGLMTEVGKLGRGGRGIVFGFKDPNLLKPGEEWVGHYFNVVNQRGVIRFLDGQTGTAANMKDFIGYRLLITKP